MYTFCSAVMHDAAVTSSAYGDGIMTMKLSALLFAFAIFGGARTRRFCTEPRHEGQARGKGLQARALLEWTSTRTAS